MVSAATDRDPFPFLHQPASPPTPEDDVSLLNRGEPALAHDTSRTRNTFLPPSSLHRTAPHPLACRYINAADFASPADLARYLLHVGSNESAFMKYYEWWTGDNGGGGDSQDGDGDDEEEQELELEAFTDECVAVGMRVCLRRTTGLRPPPFGRYIYVCLWVSSMHLMWVCVSVPVRVSSTHVRHRQI
jgi:hypothetical protein